MTDCDGVSTPAATVSDSASGAAAALAGYEYQLNVSILAALKILLITKSAGRITLEPANDEDLEIDLAPDRPGRIESTANLHNGYKLVVQVKRRSGEPWSCKDFERLMNHGTDRTPARKHLDDPDTHYLLVTSADAKGVARGLLVSDFEECADPGQFPVTLRRTLTSQPEGRVAILGGMTDTRLNDEIERILGRLLRVPLTLRQDCLAALRKEALQRMRGSTPGVWTRDDLLGIVRSHGGYLASAAELESFVPSANFSEMLAKLESSSAILISGPSGTGKTVAALALCDEARKRNDELNIVTVSPSDDPVRTRRLLDTGPTLFYIEDPWGQYSLRGGAEAWTDQLPRLMTAARSDHLFVVTSRSDMIGQARASEKFKRWSVPLEAGHYRDGQLALIYDKRMDLLATEFQAKALEFRERVLGRLETPLELDLFFTNLADGPGSDEKDEAFLRRLLELSHRDAVEGIVVQYLSSMDAVGTSAVVWALLVTHGQFDRAQLTVVQRHLRALDPALGDGVDKLVDRLIATRHLRQPARSVSFAHPSVRAGFEAYLAENWLRNEAALEKLIDALLLTSGVFHEWGKETAALVLAEAMSFSATVSAAGTAFAVSSSSQFAIDQWLEQSLLDTDSDFQPLLQLAANVGSGNSVPCELARWFINGVQRGASFFIDDWEPPHFSDAWYEKVAADARSAVIAARFVREQLPHDNSMFSRNFAGELDRIAKGLTPAFIDAAHKIVGQGFDRNAQAIAHGAIRNIEAYESVLIEALDELAALNGEHPERCRRWRQIEDGECDAAFEEYYGSAHEDEGYVSGIFAETYIATLRTAGRWRDIQSHPRVGDLARGWANAATRGQDAGVEEIRAIIAATRPIGEEHEGWNAARENWAASLGPDLEARILDRPKNQHLRSSLAECALRAAPGLLPECFAAFAGDWASYLHLLLDMVKAGHIIPSKRRKAVLDSVIAKLRPEATEIYGALGTDKEVAKPVSEPVLAFIEEAAITAPPALLQAIVPVMIASGAKPIEVIRRWLVETSNKDCARAAADAAVAVGDAGLLELALGHVRAGARLAAFKELAASAGTPLPTRLLSMAADPSAQVRLAVLGEVRKRSHAEHLPVLERLIGDDWSDALPQYDEPQSHPIARQAVEGLADYAPLTERIVDELLGLAKKTEDRDLREKALEAVAEHGGLGGRRKVWGMVSDKNLQRLRVDALDALALARFVEPEFVSRITADRILKLRGRLAASATVFASLHLPIDEAIRLIEQLGNSSSHRSLLLLGAVAVEARDRDTALMLLELLPVGHPARAILDNGDKLPSSILDDLGDVRIRHFVREWLPDRIGKA